ncbi:unnamed protein product [Effrenium voratum]|nr:unnamed protein product [Effrenium voratum]CAJ1431310.1 unnamed protein product [Effrenium voratum]|mmetsp:Transcript_12109/g.28701  ORF Transcript_12109/g.28701 Transcript_12109/m.28701 type:complete len:202 (-) Transcript_12109:68-673(-)
MVQPRLCHGPRRKAFRAFAALAAALASPWCFSVVASQSKEPEQPKLLGAAAPDSPLSSQETTGSVPLARVAPRKFRILFTCKVCETRNSHMISRLAYQQGIVIATCPGCGNRHLLADKTGLLDVGIWDVEMLAQRGENVTRLTTDGYTQVDGELNRTSNSPGASPLLVRNKDGLLEALPEENLGVSRAVDFMADTADEAMS